MSSSLAAYLRDSGIGIDEDDLLEVVRRSLEEVLGSARPDEPALPADERRRLEAGGFALEPRPSGADHPAVRSAAEFAALFGSAATVAEAARRLGVNPTRIRQRLTGPKRTLYGIKRDREWRLPRFQFKRRGLVPGIAQVIAALDAGLHPVSVWRWFTTPHQDLLDEESGERLSPLAWLDAGHDPREVVALAANL